MVTINGIKNLQPAYQEQVRQAEKKLDSAKNGTEKVRQQEILADLVDQFGLHDESRKLYLELANFFKTNLEKARCWRKITQSFINQRDHGSAVIAAEKALEIIRRSSPESKEEKTEYFYILIQSCSSYYFNLQYEKIDEIVKELRKLFTIVTEPRQQIDFYFSVCLDFLQKYRWYQLPEEAVSHCQLYIHLANQTGEAMSIAMAKTVTGFVHLWREEITISQKYFNESIEMLGEINLGSLMICYTYMGIGYRMQNNLSMTERWAGLTIEKAEKTDNKYYLASGYANMAWVYARRKNWLYAEDFARKAVEEMMHKSPLTYLAIFPLLEALLQKNATDEAGKYIFYMLHPKNKRLPLQLTKNLKEYITDWVAGKKETLNSQLQEIVSAAKITGYY